MDTNWTVTYPEYADIIMTSIEKRLDVSTDPSFSYEKYLILSASDGFLGVLHQKS